MDEDKAVKPSPMKKAKTEPKSPTKIKESKRVSSSPPPSVSAPKGSSKNGKNGHKSPPKTEAKPKVKSEPKSSPVKSKDEPKISPKKAPKSPLKQELSKAVTPMIVKNEETPAESLLWVDKYKPTTLKQIIGQQTDKSNMKKLLNWLQNWPKNNLHNQGKRPPRPPPFASHNDDGAWAKCALLSGPPGVGKTTTSYLGKYCGITVCSRSPTDFFRQVLVP